MKKKLKKEHIDKINEILLKYVKTLRVAGFSYKEIRKMNDSLLDKIFRKYQVYQSQLIN